MSYALRTGRPKRTMLDAELAAVLKVSGEHRDGFRDHCILSLAVGTALREHEIAGLDLGDVTHDGRRLLRTIQLRTFKRSRHRSDDPGYQRAVMLLQKVVLPDSTYYKLEKWIRGLRAPRNLDRPLFLSERGQRLWLAACARSGSPGSSGPGCRSRTPFTSCATPRSASTASGPGTSAWPSFSRGTRTSAPPRSTITRGTRRSLIRSGVSPGKETVVKLEEEDPSIKTYPLAWPVGRPRSKSRAPAAFRDGAGTGARLVSIEVGVRRLMNELRRFNATNVVISTNIKPTLSGRPSRETPDRDDPGAAVYFRLDGRPHAMSCDRWSRVADNLAALAAHVEATRGQLRWGCADVAQVFAGFRELPAVGQKKPWWTVLGFKEAPASSDLIERKRDELARLHHPDFGGNPNQMAEINAAVDEGRRALGRRP